MVRSPSDRGRSRDHVIPAWVNRCRTLNPSALFVNSGEDQDSSLGHSGLLLPSEAIYKELGKDLQGSVLN